MTVSKITNAPTQKELIDKTNEIIDNLGGGGGSSTDVQINGTSITSGGTANIITNSAYNASSNKIATMSDVPSTSGLANTDLSNLTATGEAHFLKNTATGTNALTLLGTPATYASAVNIGAFSSASNLNSTAVGRGSYASYYATAFGCYSIAGDNFSTAIGENSNASDYRATAIGYNASATQNASIQIGYGTNSTANTLSIGFYDGSDAYNYQLLDGTTGLIPDDRISTNIQRTSTAVTHTANTAVGNSTTPVYINSSGVATSTGLSIASTRFDGGWIKAYAGLDSSTAIGTYDLTTAVASLLPNDNYCYELLIYCTGNSSNGSQMYISSNLCDEINAIWCSANARNKTNIFIIPVDSTRKLTKRIANAAFTSSTGTAIYAYRRIGTNS